MRLLAFLAMAVTLTPPPSASPMHAAAHAGDLDSFTQFLAQEGALEMLYAPDGNGNTPLHVAAAGGHVQFVKLALQFASRTAGDQEATKLVRVENFKGGTILHDAVRAQRIELVQLLLDNGALVDARNSRKQTPILVSATVGAGEIAAVLLAHGADPGQRDVNGLAIGELAERSGHAEFREKAWPLHAAAALGDGAKVASYLKSGLNAVAVDDRGDTAIRVAANWQHTSIVEQLQKVGAKPDVFVAVALGNNDLLLKLLGQAPALLNATDGYGFTPLHWAVRHKRKEMIAALCSPETIEAKTHDQKTPLDLAIEFDFADIVRALAAAGVDLNKSGAIGRTRLHAACRTGDEKAVTLLCSVGANIDSLDYQGQTPLHYAVEGERAQLVEQLIKAGANVNIATHSGDTPLHAAAQRSASITKILLENGADANAKDNDGAPPLFRIVRAPRPAQVDITRLLIDGGADASAKDTSGNSVLDQLYKQASDDGVAFDELKTLLIQHGAEYTSWHGPRELLEWSRGKAAAATGASVRDDDAYSLFVSWLNESVQSRRVQDTTQKYELFSEETYQLWRSLRAEHLFRSHPFKPSASEKGDTLSKKRERILSRYGREDRHAIYSFLVGQEKQFGTMIPDPARALGWDGPDFPFGWDRQIVQATVGDSDTDEIAYLLFVRCLHTTLHEAGIMDYRDRFPKLAPKTISLWRQFRPIVSAHIDLFSTGELSEAYLPNNLRKIIYDRNDDRFRRKARRLLERHMPEE